MATGCSEAPKPRLFGGLWGLLIVLCLARGLAFASRTHVVPFYPELMQQLDINYTATGTLYSAYMFSYALLLPFCGAASDRYSPRLMVGSGFLLMALGTVGLAFTPWFSLAVVGRVIQGVGTALVYAASLKLVAVSFPKRIRAKALSAIEVVISASMLITLTAFPVLSHWISLKALFLSLAATLGVGMLLLPSVPNHPMGQAEENGAESGPRESIREILGRQVLLLMSVSFIGLFVVNAFYSWLPTYFNVELEMGKNGSGLLMAVLLVTQMVSASLAGIISDHWGRRLPAIQIGGASLAVAALVAMPALHGYMPYAVAFLAGGAIGWAISPLQALATESFGPRRAGTVAAISSAAGQAGGVVAGVLFGYIIDVTGSFRYVWLIAALAALLRIGVASFLKEGGGAALTPNAEAVKP